MKNLILVCLVFIQFCSCTKKLSQSNSIETIEKNETINDGYTTTSKRNKTGASSSIEHEKVIMNLDDHIRGLAGVNVSGTGASASITVRGINSFQAESNEPLFIVNGNPMPNFTSAYTAANAVDIKRVTVLTDAASTGIYGVRGANGVILVTLKNTK